MKTREIISVFVSALVVVLTAPSIGIFGVILGMATLIGLNNK